MSFQFRSSTSLSLPSNGRSRVSSPLPRFSRRAPLLPSANGGCRKREGPTTAAKGRKEWRIRRKRRSQLAVKCRTVERGARAEMEMEMEGEKELDVVGDVPSAEPLDCSGSSRSSSGSNGSITPPTDLKVKQKVPEGTISAYKKSGTGTLAVRQIDLTALYVLSPYGKTFLIDPVVPMLNAESLNKTFRKLREWPA